MADVQQYTGLITSRHADKPKFLATIEATVAPFVLIQNVLTGLGGADFDLDTAIGAQLDVIGVWVGVSRRINTPLSTIYFSLDVVGLGFDQGIWMGPFDPSTGVVILDDDSYRALLRSRIAANNWDGTMENAKPILDSVFGPNTFSFIQDNQDMSMVIGIAGEMPSAVILALISQGYISLKPAAVRVSFYIASSESGTPIFGFDSDNDYIGGFDNGSWGNIL